MIYFDNSATTPVLPEVAQSMQKAQEMYFANPSSLHKLGVNAHTLLTQARNQAAQLLRVQSSEIIFTSGGTESNNTAIIGTAFEKEAFGKHIITSAIEHPSVSQAMRFLEKRGFTVTVLPVDRHGVISVNDLKSVITDETILVSTMWVNNEVGSIMPVDDIARVLNDYEHIHWHVDAVQALGYVLEKGILPRMDLVTLSSHKNHGPRGVGILYKKEGRRIQPLALGGGQESKWRSGTENVAGIVGMVKSIRLYQETNASIETIQQDLRTFFNMLDKVVVLSPENGAPHILTVALVGIRGEVMVHALEEHGIYISTTSACSSKVANAHHTLGAMQVEKSVSQCAVRLSFSKLNTLDEVEKFKEKFMIVYNQFLTIL